MEIQNRIRFVGHATVWATLNGQHFLIDTHFSDRILGLIKRQKALGIDLQNLPDVSALLVTHAHYDHLDIFSYKFFSRTKPVVSPIGLKSLINRFIQNDVHEMKPWEEKEFGDVKVIAVPTRHKGWRVSGLTHTECVGYVMKGRDFTVYHPGDTAYGPHFAEIGKQFKIDVACLPIGANRPTWLMKPQHLDPVQALQAMHDLGARYMIPIHWGSFKLAFEGVDDPIHKLKSEMARLGCEDKVKILMPGEDFEIL